MKKEINVKGIVVFLVLTFLITYGILFGIQFAGVSPILAGFGQYLVAAVMWVPGLVGFLINKYVDKKPISELIIKPRSWKPFLYAALVIPFCFLIIYLITFLFGLGNPDWEFNGLQRKLAEQGAPELPIPDKTVAWISLYVVTLIFAPIMNGVFGFGEELGWRGYLLPKLMQYGKLKAYILLAIIWGLWHLPLITAGFMYPGSPILGMFFFIIMLGALGIYMNELTLKYQSSLLAGWIHGIFNSQRLGVWAILFPDINPFIGGFSGTVGIVIWLALGFIILRRNKK
ncbi:MAG: CPBP family intramembrane glutamic endopeptidase [Bacteroidia bacterium]